MANLMTCKEVTKQKLQTSSMFQLMFGRRVEFLWQWLHAKMMRCVCSAFCVATQIYAALRGGAFLGSIELIKP
eukprot:3279861-Rhodomonas_salina.1